MELNNFYLTNSYKNKPAATATLSDCVFTFIGIYQVCSSIFIMLWCIPKPSLPISKATDFMIKIDFDLFTPI
ncbi:hypothetical protein ACSSV5_000877 [Psychroflexus sp. MBR-150]